VGLKKNQQPEKVANQQLRSGGEQKKIPVSRSKKKWWDILRAEVVDCEPELKRQVPERRKRLQRRGLAG
jgi:hypothetical protein